MENLEGKFVMRGDERKYEIDRGENEWRMKGIMRFDYFVFLFCFYLIENCNNPNEKWTSVHLKIFSSSLFKIANFRRFSIFHSIS